METLTAFYKKLLRETDTGFNRYLYSDINWRNRIIGIKGPRGVGKTTLMLQHIKQDMNPDDVLYVNADDIYFSSHRLLDLAGLLVQRGIHYFYIDEIHKYKEWSRELKLIYDYYSELNVVFSGSSVLDLTKSAAGQFSTISTDCHSENTCIYTTMYGFPSSLLTTSLPASQRLST